MGRKSPYNEDMDTRSDRRQSMRSGSVTSSELSETSSIGKKSSAAKIVAVIVVSLAIVALLVGITIYMIDVEKEKQELEREERIEEGIETEMEFAEAANAYKANDEDITEKYLEHKSTVRGFLKSTDIYDGLNKLSKKQIEELKNLNQRRRFLENFKKSKQEDFLRPTEEEKAFISSLIANRKSVIGNPRLKITKEEVVTPMSSTTTSQTTISWTKNEQKVQNLEFEGVGLFETSQVTQAVTEKEEVVTDFTELYNEATNDNHNHNLNVDNQQPSLTSQSRNSLQPKNEESDQRYQTIYDMSSYVKQTANPMQPNRGNHPRRNFRPRQRLLRPGLEGYRRIDNMEEMLPQLEAMEESAGKRYQIPLDSIETSGPSVKMTDTSIVKSEERPIIPLHTGQVVNEAGLATIDRRPGRPTFHHQGPMGNNGMGGRPFGRRRFRNQPAMQMRQGLGTPKDQLATESLHRNTVVDTAFKQDEILSNFDSFLKIAGSELGSLRNVAKEITQSGKEVNLWEILAAVNETVRKSPDSSISQLMSKFEVSFYQYLAQD